MSRVHEEIGGVQPIPFRDGRSHAVDPYVGRGLGDATLALAIHNSDAVPRQPAGVVGQRLAVVVRDLDRQVLIHLEDVVHHDSRAVGHSQRASCDGEICHVRAGPSTPLVEGLPRGILHDGLAGGVPLDLVVLLKHTCLVACNPELHVVRKGLPVGRSRHCHANQASLGHPHVGDPRRRCQRDHQIQRRLGTEGVGHRDGGARLIRQGPVEEQRALGGAHDGLVVAAVVVGGIGLGGAVREELELGEAQVREVSVASLDHHVRDGEGSWDRGGGNLDVADCLCLLGVVTIFLRLSDQEALVARWVDLNPRALGVLKRPAAIGLLPRSAALNALGSGGQGGVVAGPARVQHAVVVARLPAHTGGQAQSVSVIDLVACLIAVAEAIGLCASSGALVLAVVRHPDRQHARKELGNGPREVPHGRRLGLHVVQHVGLAVSSCKLVGVLAVAQHFQSVVVLGVAVADSVLVTVGLLPASFRVFAGSHDVVGKVNLEHMATSRGVGAVNSKYGLRGGTQIVRRTAGELESRVSNLRVSSTRHRPGHHELRSVRQINLFVLSPLAVQVLGAHQHVRHRFLVNLAKHHTRQRRRPVQAQHDHRVLSPAVEI
mmetsp:Transcript_41035/g.98497  ORF Transcript_41035/g.98497 Transcript_41035/m.98497 type:complete len:603 (-) Transcript_41035:528-2336(-)